MKHLEIFNKIIPGYSYLSEERHTHFLEKTEAGVMLDHIAVSIMQLAEEFEDIDKESDLFTRIAGWLLYDTAHSDQEEIQNQIVLKKNSYLADYQTNPAYLALKKDIVNSLLLKEIEDLRFLNEEELEQLSQADFSQALLNDNVFTNVEEARKESGWLAINHSNFLYDKHRALTRWKAAFETAPEFAVIRRKIDYAKNEPHAADFFSQLDKLASELPLLHYRSNHSADLSYIDELYYYFQNASREEWNNDTQYKMDYLAKIFLNIFSEVHRLTMNLVNLDQFNQKQAELLAQKVIDAIQKNKTLTLAKWLEEYETELHHIVDVRLKLINEKIWSVSDLGEAKGLMNSLSYLFWNHNLVNSASTFFDKLADAHAFIQATSFSTQNESSFLAILDLYNYYRFAGNISETKSILAGLLSPFAPIYDEYRDIALKEKNPYRKAFRSLVPVLITVGVIIAISVALTPLALPELAFVAVFIPALFIGLLVTSLYISRKDSIYQSIRQWYYGGKFEIPEFQINERMRQALGEGNAIRVRNLYIDAIQKCDDAEMQFTQLHKQGLLAGEQLQQRQENTKLRHQLNLEWYDIHSNNNLGYDQIAQIIQRRLKENGDIAYKKLVALEQQEHHEIHSCITRVVSDIKSTITVPKPRNPLSVQETTLKISNTSNGFFSPRCIPEKQRAEELAKLNENIKERVQTRMAV